MVSALQMKCIDYWRESMMDRMLLVTCLFVFSCIQALAEQKQPDGAFVFGYTDKLSCVPGEEIGFHLSSSSEAVDLSIERQGGINEQVFEKSAIPCATYPIPDRASSDGCNWPATFTMKIPIDWKSGCYIATLSFKNGEKDVSSQVLFVVRSGEPGKNTGILLQ